LDQVQTTLSDNKPAKIVVATAVDVLALSNPLIGTLVATYKVSKVIYRVTSKAYETYNRTGDTNEAVKAAAQEVVHVGIGAVRDQAIGKVVDVGWSAMKTSAGVATDEIQDRILTTAAKNTLKEVLPR